MARKFANGADLQNQKVINVGDGTAPTGAVNRQQLDAASRGFDWKQEVIAGSTGNVSLTAPGSTLDGVTLTANMQAANAARPQGTYILLKDQTAPAENGIYLWTGAAVALTRSVDADTYDKIAGSTVTIQRGTVNADRAYRASSDDGGTLNTTAIAWAQTGGASAPYTAGNGLALAGQQFSVTPKPSSGITVDSQGVGVDFTLISRKAWFNIGDGSATSIVITHNWGTLDVSLDALVEVANGAEWDGDVTARTTNTVTIGFATAPAANAFRAKLSS